jgi:HEAT repeat protein
MFLFKPPNIEKLYAKRDVKGLIKALYYYPRGDNYERIRKAANIRNSAAMYLGEIGNPLAVPALVDFATTHRRFHDDMHFHVYGIDALEKIGDPTAIKALTVFALSDGHKLQRSATLALARIGKPEVVDTIITVFLNSPKNDFLLGDNAMNELLERLGSNISLLSERLKPGLDLDRKPLLQGFTIRVLQKIGDQQAIDSLIDVIKTEKYKNSVRVDAIDALAKLRATQAVKPLLKLLETHWKRDELFNREGCIICTCYDENRY